MTTKALGGAIERRADGWYWRTGVVEPRVRDMPMRWLAPNLRCTTYAGRRTYVEIPASWRQPRYWPDRRVDQDVAAAIEQLIAECGKRSPIYAEGLAEPLDDHRLSIDGYRVDVAQWDAVMCEPIGACWDGADEAEILARARELGWTG
jgi:hypothetical protein